MGLIKGKTITLYERVQSGTDAFNNPTYTTNVSQVQNVLIQPTSADAIVQEMQMYGRHSVYTLHIPKDDAHTWEGSIVVLGNEFGQRKYRQFGDVMHYQEEMCPLDWKAQVKVEVYE